MTQAISDKTMSSSGQQASKKTIMRDTSSKEEGGMSYTWLRLCLGWVLIPQIGFLVWYKTRTELGRSISQQQLETVSMLHELVSQEKQLLQLLLHHQQQQQQDHSNTDNVAAAAVDVVSRLLSRRSCLWIFVVVIVGPVLSALAFCWALGLASELMTDFLGNLILLRQPPSKQQEEEKSHHYHHHHHHDDDTTTTRYSKHQQCLPYCAIGSNQQSPRLWRRRRSRQSSSRTVLLLFVQWTFLIVVFPVLADAVFWELVPALSVLPLLVMQCRLDQAIRIATLSLLLLCLVRARVEYLGLMMRTKTTKCTTSTTTTSVVGATTRSTNDKARRSTTTTRPVVTDEEDDEEEEDSMVLLAEHVL